MDPNYPRPLQKLAIMYDSRMEFHTSFRIYTNMMTLKNRMDMEALTLNPSKAYAAKMQGMVEIARQSAKRNGRKILVIYCNEYEQTWWPNWGPNSMDTGGVGGSEEAVIFLSKELRQKFGYHVEVYGEALPQDWGDTTTGVWWLPHQIYNALAPATNLTSLSLGDIIYQLYMAILLLRDIYGYKMCLLETKLHIPMSTLIRYLVFLLLAIFTVD